jgi:predicted P-loop ATPase
LQGVGKSRALRTLASDPWFADEIGDPSNKDAAEALRGKWIIEIGELRWKKSDEATMKAFISRRIDHYRPAYGRRAVDIPRQCVLAATTNESNWQTDPTGARRYWCVECHRIDVDAVTRDRDLLWAEAVARYDSGEPSWLQDDELPSHQMALESRREPDPWDAYVLPWLGLRTEVTIEDVLTSCLAIEPQKQTLGDSRRVGRVLRANGWLQAGQKGSRGSRKKIWQYKGVHSTGAQ